MTQETIRIEALEANSIMGLLASEGKVPGAISKAIYTPKGAAQVEAIEGFATDLREGANFFDLMVEAGQMKQAEAPVRVPTNWMKNFRIHRPVNLGGYSLAH